MTEQEQLEKLKQNILELSRSMSDAPFHGVSRENINGVNFAIKKILKGTDITIASLLEEVLE